MPNSHQYLVSRTAFSYHNVPRETADRHTVWIHQSTVMLANAADSEQEITLPIKHLQTNADGLCYEMYCLPIFV